MSTSDPDRLVRPYVMTRGRTRPAEDLPLEALVESRVTDDERIPLSFEPGRVVELCRAPRSVAEVAAALTVPIGVARVLIADLAANGTVTIHRTATADGPDIPLLERLLDGLSSC
jgi:hypothetical protein